MQTTFSKTSSSSDLNGLERVRAHVQDHFADELPVDQLAQLAGFSKSHFQRMFRKTFGETLCEHIKRIRLEKSACLLITAGGISMTDLAYACGFSSSQSYSRAFKAHYGIPPTQLGPDVGRGLISLKKWQNMQTGYGEKYLLPQEVGPEGAFIQIPSWTSEGKGFFQALRVADMPSLRVAYVRSIVYPGSDELFTAMYRLADWAVPRGLFTSDARLLRAISPDPDVEGRFICDASVTVPDDIDAKDADGVHIQYLPAGEYGIYHAKFLCVEDILEAWKRLTLGWWISSYSCRDRRPLYEIYYNSPDMHPDKSFIIDLCLPITTRRRK